MAYDIPQFSQLALIGYSRAQYNSGDGHINLRDGYPGRWRTQISVSAETAVNLTFSGGSKTKTLLNGRLKLTINGNAVQCMFFNECGFYANGEFTLTATTAGNDVLQGCSITKTITVLIWGKDNPHLNGNFFQFQVGQLVDVSLNGNTAYYADDPDTAGGGVCYPVDGGYSGGTAIGNKNGKNSGLVYMNRDGAISLTGIAGRPGLYAVWVTSKSLGPQAGGIFNPFWGDSADDVIIISIVQRYHVGDLALIVPASVAGYDDGNALKFIHYAYDGLAWIYPYPYKAVFHYDSNSDAWTGTATHISGSHTEYYEYKIIPQRENASNATTGNWRLYARWYMDSPGNTEWTLYDNAQCRGLIDEKPPKNGWGNSGLILAGGDLKYLDGNGFFSYAGLKQVSIDNQPYKVKYYQSETMYTHQYTGWTNRPPQYQYGNGKYLYQNPVTQKWNIVQGVIFNNSDVSTSTAVQDINTIALPVAPPRKGDVICEVGGVAHSLNKKPETGEFCLNLNGVSFGLWQHYHLHRLLDPARVSGTISINANFRKTTDFGQHWGSGMSAPDTPPDSVQNILAIARKQGNSDWCYIQQGFDMTKLSGTETFTASLEQDLSLRHKLLNGDQLAQILNCKTADHPEISSQGDTGKTNYQNHNLNSMQRFVVFRPPEEAVADDDYNYHWEVTSGNFSLTHYSHQEWHNTYVDDQGHEHHYTDYRNETRRVSGTWTKSGGEHISEDIEIVTEKSGYNASPKTTTNHGTSRGIANVGWSVGRDGTVSVSGGWFNVGASNTGKYTASCSGSNDGDTVSVSASAEQFVNADWDYGYSAQKAQQFPGITWDFKQTYQRREEYEIQDKWVTDSTTPTEGGIYIGGKAWFGCGRQANNNTDVCGAVGNGWANANASGRKQIRHDYTYRLLARYEWHEDIESDSRIYDYEEQPYESTSTIQQDSTSWTISLGGGVSAGVVEFLPGGGFSLSGRHERQDKQCSGAFSWSCFHISQGIDDEGSNANIQAFYFDEKNSATNCPSSHREGEENDEYDTKAAEAKDLLQAVEMEIPLDPLLHTHWSIDGSYSETTSRVRSQVSVSGTS